MSDALLQRVLDAFRAAGILFVSQDNALFLRRVDTGEWSIPAGGIETDETPEVAAQREAAEEVGNPGHNPNLIDQRVTNGVEFFTYLALVDQEFDPILNDEHDAFEWAPLEHPPQPLHPGLRATLDALFERYQGKPPVVIDAAPRRRDPTRTQTLRRAFRAAAELRLRRVRALLRVAVVDHDMLGLSSEVMGFAAPAARLAAFNAWFEAMARTELAGVWVDEWVRKAIQAGEKRALGETQAEATGDWSALDHLFERANSELKGIAAALAQQVGRLAAQVVGVSSASASYRSRGRRDSSVERPWHGDALPVAHIGSMEDAGRVNVPRATFTRSRSKSKLLQPVRPAAAFRFIVQPFERIAKQRLKPFAHDVTVRGFNLAKIAIYRANGVTHVGINPELVRHRHRRGQVAHDAFDPSEERDPQGRWTSGGGSFSRGDRVVHQGEAGIVRTTIIKNEGRFHGVKLDNGQFRLVPVHELKLAAPPAPAKASETELVRAALKKTEYPESAKLEKQAGEEPAGDDAPDLIESTPAEFSAGFLTPNGKLLEIASGHTHEGIAKLLGTSLDAVMAEGTARIYGGDFLGIDITKRPTAAQMRAIQAIRATQRPTRFAIESLSNQPYLKGDKPITAAYVTEQLNKAFPLKHGDAATFFWDQDEDEPPDGEEPTEPEPVDWLGGSGEDQLVGWLTAGDEFVCPLCEELADGSPYSLDEAQALIPVHIDCRCTVYPWSDQRFAGDAAVILDEEEGHPFRGNQYITGESDPKEQEAIRARAVAATALTKKGVLAALGEREPRSRNLKDIMIEINQHANEFWKQHGVPGGVVNENNHTPETDDIISSALAQELDADLSNGQSDEHWYSKRMEETMRIAEKLHPEIAGDADKKFLFTVALAIPSQGEVVDSAARLADMAYTQFRNTGKFPTNIKVKTPSINENFQALNELIAEKGVAGTREFFSQKFTKKQLLAMGHTGLAKIGMNEQVYGSAVLGQKIGQGFYQNLSGNFDPLTADIWFMRTWGRLTGSGVSFSNVAAAAERLRAALKQPKMSEEKLAEVAAEKSKAWEKSYAALRESGLTAKQAVAKKTELAYAAQNFLEYHGGGLIEVPTGSKQRAWMQQVLRQALTKLATRPNNPRNLNMAGAQATIWNPEKLFLAKLGYKKTMIDTNYALAMRRLAEKKGIVVDAAPRYLEYAPWIEDIDPEDVDEIDEQDYQDEFEEEGYDSSIYDAYDPNEARDPHGQWTAGGHGSAADYPPQGFREEGGNIVAFHGTTDEVVRDIAKNGIRVTPQKVEDYYDDERGNSVYIANNLRTALGAANARRLKFGHDMVVFTLKIPKNEWSRFKADEEAWDTAARGPFISPAWIAGATRYDPATAWREGGKGEPITLDADLVTKYMVIFVAKPETQDAYDPNEARDPQGKWTSGGGSASDKPLDYSEFKPPQQTIKAYKLFRTLKSRPGEIFPTQVSKTTSVPIGKWVPAEYVPTKGFAARPGWHAGTLPMAPQMRSKQGRIQPGHVWAEVEMEADRHTELQAEADKSRTRDLPGQIPKGGWYQFKPNSKMFKAPWIISGAMQVKRILPDHEVAAILNKAGFRDDAKAETH